MDVYMSEKEQIQKIKEWWKKYGTSVLLGLVIFLGASFGWRYWNSYKTKRAESASVIYQQVLNADIAKQTENVQLYSQHLMDDYSSTPYASLAALILARDNVVANKLDAAKDNLQWIIKHSSNKAFIQIAKIRQARILIAEKQPQKAIDLLRLVDSKAYTSLINETRGDAYLGLGKKDDALEAYSSALKAKTHPGVDAAILAMKVNMLKH